MPSRKTGAGEENVYDAAKKWVDAALRSDDSLFTPSKPIWTRELLGELHDKYLNNPDVSGNDFYDKLRKQLEGSPDVAHQLMAEVLYFHYLVIHRTGMRGETKEHWISQVIGWSGQQIVIPADLVEGLKPGIARSQALNQFRAFHVGFIIEFVERWKELEPEQRQRLLGDPWRSRTSRRSLNLRVHSPTKDQMHTALNRKPRSI